MYEYGSIKIYISNMDSPIHDDKQSAFIEDG